MIGAFASRYRVAGSRLRVTGCFLLLLTIGCASADVPVRNVHRYFTTYKHLSAPLFAPGGPSPYEVRQGEVGSCWLLAAFAATARQQPRIIQSMFDQVGSDSYRVTFHDTGARLVVVNVAASVPFRWFASEPLYAGTGTAIWVSLLEKAYAKAFAPTEGYEGIGGDHPRLALARVTGWPVRDFDIDGDLSRPGKEEEWKELLAAYEAGAPIVVGSRIAQLRTDIVPMHAYAVTAMERDDDGNAAIRLFDPEGLNPYPNSELRLSLDDLVASFYYASIAQPPEVEKP
jgi:hypothetical protein